MRARLFVTILLLMFACSTKQNNVELSFGDTTTTPIGFRCRDSTGKLLDARAVDATTRTMTVSIVTDFIALNGFPDCRGDDVLNWCEANPCNALPMRNCIELSAPLTAATPTTTAGTASTAMNQILGELPGHTVIDDAPTQAVIVRVVATAEPCATLGDGAFDTTMLTGCAFSCPLLLNDVSGQVLLDLPTITDLCEDDVIACAGGVLR